VSDVWPVVHTERRSLISFLESIEPSQWDEPSLCPGWTVHDVVAHVVDTAKIVHGEDIRHPLGATHAYPLPAVERALQLQARTSQSWGGAKELLAGLTFRADDTGTSIGSGPAATGSALSLLMVASGRSAFLPQLDGPGAPTLASRLDEGSRQHG